MSSTNATASIALPAHAASGWNFDRIRSKIADSTLIQAALAGALSFTHIRDVALRYHQDGWKSWVYPLSVDLLTVAAYRKIKNERSDKAIPWLCFTMGLIASLAANIADAIANAPTGAGRADLTASVIVGMWPAAAFLGSTLLGHGQRTTAKPDTDRPTKRRAPAAHGDRPTPRPTAPIVQPSNRPTEQPTPIAVRPTSPLGDLGPRAATVGELPMDVWVTIARPIYQEIRQATGGRPTETALQAALAERSAALIAARQLPPAVGQPSISTAKRIRAAIEGQRTTTGRPMAALTT